MKRMTVKIFLSILILGLSIAQGKVSAQTATENRSGLKVLYVGPSPNEDPKTPRYISGKEAERYVQLKRERFAAFEKLLSRHFHDFKMLVAEDYQVEMSAKYDVTIFDERPPVIDTVELDGWSKKIRLPDDFSHAVLMVGEVAPMTVGRFGNDYLLDHL